MTTTVSTTVSHIIVQQAVTAATGSIQHVIRQYSKTSRLS